MQEDLDELIRTFTGFKSWEEMKSELDRGYIPVVVNKDFQDVLTNLGYKSWDGLTPR